MSSCRPRIMDCLNDIDQFLEARCNCRPTHNCNCGCCRDDENLFAPCNDRRGHTSNCHANHQPCNQSCNQPCCNSCGNSFGDVLHDFIGKKVMLSLGNKCGAVVILDVHSQCVRAMVVGSGKIILINSDNIGQIRPLC